MLYTYTLTLKYIIHQYTAIHQHLPNLPTGQLKGVCEQGIEAGGRMWIGEEVYKLPLLRRGAELSQQTNVDEQNSNQYHFALSLWKNSLASWIALWLSK